MKVFPLTQVGFAAAMKHFVVRVDREPRKYRVSLQELDTRGVYRVIAEFFEQGIHSDE